MKSTSNHTSDSRSSANGKRGRQSHRVATQQSAIGVVNSVPPPLHAGDRLTQAEFHRRYEAYPDHVKFELIGGVVYMPSPLRRPHGRYHYLLGTVYCLYEIATPGLEGLNNATTILGEYSEPQPDLSLRILPEWGGRSQTSEDDYVTGAPELMTEISHSTKEKDLKAKKVDYRKEGVQEYLVVCVKERELQWFHFPSRRQIVADAHGVYRSRVFPGLWIDGPALFAKDMRRELQVLQEGLDSPQHAAFVKRLQATHRKHSSD